ncbi:MAG: hypothetical protein N4A50_05055 [Vallitalea sp.]|jgi:hypothetical protein|nr:hypothetical protein [Vallitalea sp.]
MNNNKNLIGKWSIDIMYGPGAQEDTFVVFLEDGTGWIEYISSVFVEYDTFNWNISNNGELNIVGIDNYDCDEGYSKSTIKFTNLKYEIKVEQTPSDIEMEVLTFSEPLRCYECKFGIEKRDVNDIKTPKLD